MNSQIKVAGMSDFPAVVCVAALRTPDRGLRAALALSALAAMLAGQALASPLPALEPGHWYEIPNSRVDAVDPCPADNCPYTAVEGQTAVINDWNGGAYDSVNDRLIVWGGGHSGYAGNEVYAFDLNTETWIRWSEPSANVSCDFSTNEYLNGSPCAMHTYDYVDFHPGSQSFVILGGASPYPQGGGGSPTAHMYSFASNAWRRGANRTGGGTLQGATTGYDPTRDVFWVLPAYNQKFAKFDPNANGGTGQWTQYADDNIDIDAASAVDPVHDLFVTVDGRGTHTVRVHDLADPSAAPVVVATSGDTTPQQHSAIGFEWDAATGQFVSWIGGTGVYTLTPPAGDWKTGTWVWAQVAAAPTNTVTPTAPNANGTYSRWRYVPSQNLFLVVNGTNENVFAYKLSAGGAPPPCDGESDWNARATAPGVVYANDFRTQEQFDEGVFPDSRVLNVTWDPTRSVTGGHSIRFAIKKTDSENSGNWRVHLRPSGVPFANGDEFYVQYRLYVPAYHLGHTYLGGGGWKTSIISEYDYSFTNHEVVLGNVSYRGYLRGYFRGRPDVGQGVDYVLWDKNVGYLGCPADPDFAHQPEIDRGPQSGGTECENNRRRYGGLYSYGTPAYGESALPDPLTGAETWRADAWQTILQHVKVGHFDQADSTVETFFAAEGDGYTLLYRKTDAILGALDAGETGYGAIWLTPFDTGKDPDPTRQDTFMNYDQLIVSTQVIAAPGCAAMPKALAVDAHAAAGTSSNANGVFEPGETVWVAPSWKNTLAATQSLTGAASNFTGPAGPAYTLDDAAASYGSVAAGATADCDGATGDCYAMTVSGARPAAHWDATFTETVNPLGSSKDWTLHVGHSFFDVPDANLFYPFVENLFHHGVTAGCGNGGYCPDQSVTRAEMAVFLLKGKLGSGHVPPPATGTVFGDVAADDFAAAWIEELASLQITAGCGDGDYCPDASATRAEMAVFLLKAEHGFAYTPPACAGAFADVACTPTPAFAVDWIEQLAAEAITGGCTPAPPGGLPSFCPDAPSTRAQMAVFLVKTFGLQLYGP